MALDKEARPHVLIVDDDPGIRASLSRFLSANGLQTSDAGSAAEARRVLRSAEISLIVLDIMMPGEDGLAFCRQLRRESGPPVIFVSALTDDIDRIVGIEMGGDDYLTKPFNPRELLARIKAVLRRVAAPVAEQAALPGPRYRFGQWLLLVAQRELVREDGLVVSLADTEFRLLMALLQHPQAVLSRQQLLDHLHGIDAGAVYDRSIDSQISRLRHKLGDHGKNPELIQTAWGAGYVFGAEVQQQ